MAKENWQKGYKNIYKTLHRKLIIEQLTPHKKAWMNPCDNSIDEFTLKNHLKCWGFQIPTHHLRFIVISL
jgi:hypothetical protein